jgi:hypothetical protein
MSRDVYKHIEQATHRIGHWVHNEYFCISYGIKHAKYFYFFKLYHQLHALIYYHYLHLKPHMLKMSVIHN